MKRRTQDPLPGHFLDINMGISGNYDANMTPLGLNLA